MIGFNNVTFLDVIWSTPLTQMHLREFKIITFDLLRSPLDLNPNIILA
jgi:hypothetical protein